MSLLGLLSLRRVRAAGSDFSLAEVVESEYDSADCARLGPCAPAPPLTTHVSSMRIIL